MTGGARWTIRSIVPLVVVGLGSTPVLAEPKTAADPQAGFGVLLAMVAMLIALIIARHKRQQYG